METVSELRAGPRLDTAGRTTGNDRATLPSDARRPSHLGNNAKKQFETTDLHPTHAREFHPFAVFSPDVTVAVVGSTACAHVDAELPRL